MRRKYEREIKLRILNASSIKRRLAALGFSPVRRRYFESNYLFDFPNQKLRKARCLLRLRFVPGGALLTFKGPPLRTRHYKVRNEYETEVQDGKTLWQVLEGLGLRETFRYEKYRTVYSRQPPGRPVPAHHGSGELVYDETPIGDYLELEGPAGWIDAMAAELGFRRQDYVIASYVRLYFDRCAELGKTPGNMVFPKGSAAR